MGSRDNPIKLLSLDGEIKTGVFGTVETIVAAARVFSDFLGEGDHNLHDAAVTFRCPEGFNAFFDALGLDDNEENRGWIDGAFKKVAGMAARREDKPAHASDCATHNAPAEAPGPCDCGAA